MQITIKQCVFILIVIIPLLIWTWRSYYKITAKGVARWKYFITIILVFASFMQYAIPESGNPVAHTKTIITNHIVFQNAPAWLKQTRIEKVTDRIQAKLEWYTRKVHVFYYNNITDFTKSHDLGPAAIAVTKYLNGKINVHLGPKVNDENFDEYFAHELVHVILRQKYKEAIPKWLEEGLANHYSFKKKVDYQWLSKFPAPKDVRELGHPFQNKPEEVLYRYKSSQAFIEMLAKKCDLENLIRLSVANKLENYLVTYCEIKDVNLAYQKWLKEKSNSAQPSKP